MRMTTLLWALLLSPSYTFAQALSPDLTAIDVPASNAGKTLITADGTWNFGPNQNSSGNETLLNGSNANGGNANLMQVGDSGKLFARSADNGWWVWDKTTGWHSSPGTPYVLTCTPPTTYTDGASITGHITFLFYRGTSPKDFTTEVSSEPACTHTYYGLTGLQYFTVTAKDPNGSESNLSNQVIVGGTSRAPNAPGTLVVKGNAQVFAVKQTKDHLATTNAVGTIPLGTLCDVTQRVNDMFVVPTSKVTWYGNVRPQAVVASCDVP